MKSKTKLMNTGRWLLIAPLSILAYFLSKLIYTLLLFLFWSTDLSTYGGFSGHLFFSECFAVASLMCTSLYVAPSHKNIVLLLNKILVALVVLLGVFNFFNGNFNSVELIFQVVLELTAWIVALFAVIKIYKDKWLTIKYD